MEHFGLICPPAPSHLTALAAIGAELRGRGHRVTMFNIADAKHWLSGAVDFHVLGLAEHPPGSLNRYIEQIGTLRGLRASRLGLQAAVAETEMLLREAPPAMQRAGVSVLLVDQGQFCGSTIAERLGVPFFSFCNAVPINSFARRSGARRKPGSSVTLRATPRPFEAREKFPETTRFHSNAAFGVKKSSKGRQQ